VLLAASDCLPIEEPVAIPDFQSIMLPLLQLAGSGETYSISQAVEDLADRFELTEEERTELLPSGQQPLFYNRVGWARTHLKKAGLLKDPRRGYFEITSQGREVLDRDLSEIDMKFLRQYREYLDFIGAGRVREEEAEELTPEEILENAYQQIREDLATTLLSYVLNSGAGFFEKLVVELLVKMGYGGSRREAARAVGKSGDGGIDGIIDEDRLGLDVIYIQAKKWSTDHSIGRPEVQRFVGALRGQRAMKGVYITTSRFTDAARDYVERIDTKVVLIDGERLASLMIDYDVGVSMLTTYEVKRLDSEYFGETLVDE
jgi:restriction system protein